MVFQHTEGSAAVTIEQNDTVIAGSDASVQFNYQDTSTPRLTSQNMTTATPLGNFYSIMPLHLVVSSANFSTLLAISLIYVKNTKGPNTDSCGAPLKTDFQFETSPSTAICLLSVSHFLSS